MKGEWCYFKSAFSKQYCDNVLNLGKQIQSKDAELGVEGMSDHKDLSYRRSKVRFIHKTDTQFKFFFDDLWNLAQIANRDWFNFDVTHIDFMQLAEYDSAYEGEYKKHHDVFWINDSQYHRKLTCVVQLTDPSEYEGGDFQLYGVNQHPDANEIKQQGTVIFIPSFIEHSANPVTSGLRHSIACWYEGPRWR